MPTISLRLTEQEHRELRAWAFEGRRSLQREIVFRLFDSRVSSGATHATQGDPAGRRDSPSGGNLASKQVASDTHFKPDFK